ncbi:DUF2505 domain-containing protein [Dermabacteraceae bacterium TAE3-ERU5]|nr:DUF2505 domain-containing protein [Dermabacteraceae bacterium TAE3-ERU5]
MKFSATMHLNGTPQQVAAMYADPEYHLQRSNLVGVKETETEVTGELAHAFTVRSTRGVDTSALPAPAAQFLGSHLRVVETQEWYEPEADGSRRTIMSYEVGGAPVKIRSDVILKPQGESTLVEVTGEFKVAIPLLGGKIEKAAAEHTQKLFAREEACANEYLAKA